MVAAVVLGLLMGYLGWVLPTPGRSLLFPTLIVFGVGAVPVLVVVLVASQRPRRRWPGVFVLSAVVLTAAACFWTYEVALPASVEWGSGANGQAQNALAQLAHEQRQYPDQAQQCTNVETGSVGPLPAPYTRCESQPGGDGGYEVTFTVTEGTGSRGLGYTDVGSSAFPDECARHLIGSMVGLRYQPRQHGKLPAGLPFFPGG